MFKNLDKVSMNGPLEYCMPSNVSKYLDNQEIKLKQYSKALFVASLLVSRGF
jgi:hypothetical protein